MICGAGSLYCFKSIGSAVSVGWFTGIDSTTASVWVKLHAKANRSVKHVFIQGFTDTQQDMPPLQIDDILEPLQNNLTPDSLRIPGEFAQSTLYFVVLCWFLVVVYYRIFPYKQP